MHSNAVYQETTRPIYPGEDVRGFHNPLANLPPNQHYPQPCLLNWDAQNGQTAVRLQNCPLKNIDNRRPKTLWRLIIVTLLLIIISVAVSCGTMLLLFKYTDVFASKFDSQTRTLCVPCSKANGNNNFRELILVKQPSEGTTKDDCCVINKELFEKMMSPVRKNSSRDASAFSNLSNNSIHVFLQAPETADRTYKGMDETSENFVKVKGWNDHVKGSGAFSRSRAQLNDAKDEIHVKDPGLYVIYSRLEFYGPLSELDSDATDSVTGPVWFGQRLRLKDQVTPLLEDSQVKTCVHNDGSLLPCYTSQLFAVLYLPKSAKLSLEAQPINLISDNTKNSYFGLFRID